MSSYLFIIVSLILNISTTVWIEYCGFCVVLKISNSLSGWGCLQRMEEIPLESQEMRHIYSVKTKRFHKQQSSQHFALFRYISSESFVNAYFVFEVTRLHKTLSETYRVRWNTLWSLLSKTVELYTFWK